MSTTDPMKKKSDIRQMRKYYLENGEYRNFLLLSFGLNTGLRISDILRLKVEDIFDFKNRVMKDHIEIKEKKTGKTIIIKINEVLKKDIRTYFRECGRICGKFLFESRKGTNAIGIQNNKKSCPYVQNRG